MSELTFMGAPERRHLEAIAEDWTEYGPALKTWAALDGGMTWKNVGGADYLCRYRQDPETSKKKFTSLGRRSPDTELAYTDFIERRDKAKATVVANRDRMATAGRVAKAYGLARLPAATGEILRTLWLRSLDDQLCLFGGSALYAYELETETITPKDLTRDDRLCFVLAGSVPFRFDDILDAIEDATGQKPQSVERGERMVVRFGTLDVEFLGAAFFTRQVDDGDEAEVLAEAFAMPPVKALVVARDGQAVEINTLDPRTYALAAHALRHEDEIWARRAEYAATLVCKRWPERFEPRQAAAFPELCGGSAYEERYRGP